MIHCTVVERQGVKHCRNPRAPPLLNVFNGNALIDTWAWTLVRTCPQYGIFFGFLDKRRLLGGNPHESKSYDQMANSHGAELELRLRAVSIAVPVFQAILLIERSTSKIRLPRVANVACGPCRSTTYSVPTLKDKRAAERANSKSACQYVVYNQECHRSNSQGRAWHG